MRTAHIVEPRIIIQDTNKYTWVNVNRDEAAIARANAEKEIELEKIKSNERKEKAKDKKERFSELSYVLLMAIVFGTMIILTITLSIHDKNSAERGEIKNTYRYADFIGQSTEVVVKRLEKLGFENVETQADSLSLTDKIKYSKYDSGDVTSVWADGALMSSSYYPKNATIIVKYKE